jgi:thioredoxin 1
MTSRTARYLSAMPTLLSPPDAGAEWTVVSLCADWCDTCRAYQPSFADAAGRSAGARFVWLDVEDDADWVDALEIETFPTLLVIRSRRPLFFGPVLPQVEVVERTLAALRSADPQAARPALGSADAAALAALAARLETLR